MDDSRRSRCPMRNESGSCLPVGDFCICIDDSICEALLNAYYRGFDTCRGAFEELDRREAIAHRIRQMSGGDPVWAKQIAKDFFGMEEKV